MVVRRGCFGNDEPGRLTLVPANGYPSRFRENPRNVASDFVYFPAMRTALIFAALATLADGASGQGNRITDEASFTISVNGRTAGRENFRITQTTRGEVVEYRARADVTYGDRKITPELVTTAEGGLFTYDVTTRSGSTTESWRGGVTARGRVSAQIASGRSSSMREFIVPAGALLLDDEIIHHHWFLALRSHTGQMPVVVPRRGNVHVTFSMATVGEETLQIGNHDLAATHLRATANGGEIHDIWVDRSGRLLKVALPARNLVAVRDDPPPA